MGPAADGTDPKRASAFVRASARPAFGDELLGLSLDVKGELVVELPFRALTAEQRSRTQLQITQVHLNSIGVDRRH